jgi:hypothetical protein
MAVPVEQEILDGQRAWLSTQAIFDGGTLREATEVETVGWYGTRTHTLEGAFAVVRVGLEDLIGETLRVTHRRRAAVVYVVAARDIPQDVAVTRRSWMAFETLSEFEVRPLVEVVA